MGLCFSTEDDYDQVATDEEEQIFEPPPTAFPLEEEDNTSDFYFVDNEDHEQVYVNTNVSQTHVNIIKRSIFSKKKYT
jgi:hypothetical protein